MNIELPDDLYSYYFNERLLNYIANYQNVSLDFQPEIELYLEKARHNEKIGSAVILNYSKAYINGAAYPNIKEEKTKGNLIIYKLILPLKMIDSINRVL